MVKLNDCPLDGVTECNEDCTKCIYEHDKSNIAWLEQQYETS